MSSFSVTENRNLVHNTIQHAPPRSNTNPTRSNRDINKDMRVFWETKREAKLIQLT